ncbi:hypothetical protein C1646_659993 [Rhizophagus diaphanus]|nr:hypothetical protein C1646_659993 [Rhizophagus diaphanus] [Rhizophagus sp. MUCL 43196]
MSMVQIWDYVLKWGVAQNPELSSDSTNYSNDDFNALSNTLQKCIFFIKFTDFTPKEFLHKVYPYKKIIPEEMYESLIKYFLDHDCNKQEPRIVGGINNQSDINSNPRVIETSNQNKDNPVLEGYRSNNLEPYTRVNRNTRDQSNSNLDLNTRVNRNTRDQSNNNPELNTRVNRNTRDQSNNNPELNTRINRNTRDQSNNNPELNTRVKIELLGFKVTTIWNQIYGK